MLPSTVDGTRRVTKASELLLTCEGIPSSREPTRKSSKTTTAAWNPTPRCQRVSVTTETQSRMTQRRQRRTLSVGLLLETRDLISPHGKAEGKTKRSVGNEETETKKHTHTHAQKKNPPKGELRCDFHDFPCIGALGGEEDPLASQHSCPQNCRPHSPTI